MSDKFERAMVITAHPDDSEFGAGGTIAKLVQDGCEVTYVIATNGDKGSSDRSMTSERLASIRAEEQGNAARALGVAHVEFLGYELRRANRVRPGGIPISYGRRTSGTGSRAERRRPRRDGAATAR